MRPVTPLDTAALQMLRDWTQSSDAHLPNAISHTVAPCMICMVPVSRLYLLPGVGVTCDGCAVKSYMVAVLDQLATKSPALPTHFFGPSRVEEVFHKLAAIACTPVDEQQKTELIPLAPSIPFESPSGVVYRAEEVPSFEPPVIRHESSVRHFVRDENGAMKIVDKESGSVENISMPHVARRRIAYEEDDEARQYVPPPTTKKATAHTHETPYVDIQSLPAGDQSFYEGYRPGSVRIASHEDVHRYEAVHGDPELMQMLEDEDWQWAIDMGYETEESDNGSGVKTRGYNRDRKLRTRRS